MLKCWRDGQSMRIGVLAKRGDVSGMRVNHGVGSITVSAVENQRGFLLENCIGYTEYRQRGWMGISRLDACNYVFRANPK